MKDSGFIPLEAIGRTRAPDLKTLRSRLAAGQGPVFWRTLEEAAESDELREYVEQEFPGLSGQIPRCWHRPS